MRILTCYPSFPEFEIAHKAVLDVILRLLRSSPLVFGISVPSEADAEEIQLPYRIVVTLLHQSKNPPEKLSRHISYSNA